ncbi:5'-methylthioadenosine/adenosylhomocysteine nucleosidase [Aquincola sp. MAHUQ-54]|uniref:adenosylhomocysteine nucleosidase n=1 Tax=Aquincola agrisoli TaxID=3119538 RepID=A0AAW9QNR1_9BURK
MTRIAVVSALHAELRALLPLVEDRRVDARGGRDFHRGRLEGHEVLLVLSGIGKVAAAATAALALDAFNAQALLFTGVAGGLAEGVQVGDVVVGRELLQHDMDASPLFPRYEVPLTGRSRFAADAALCASLAAATDVVLAQPHPALQRFGIEAVRRHDGLVVSGDRFVSTAAESAALRAALPDALAVEMEGAAVAQVCADFGRPLAVLRTVSDRADDSAHVDFERFIADVAAEFSRDIVRAALARL